MKIKKGFLLVIASLFIIGSFNNLKGQIDDENPNIVLILIDDLGWKDLSCTGSNYYQTPHIDKMAAEGILFKHAYSAAPVCAPSRGAIISGLYPARTKLTTVFSVNEAKDDVLFLVAKPRESAARKNSLTLNALHYHALPLKYKTIGNYMQAQGYYTGYFGKWHCGSYKDYTPNKRGFNIAECYRTKLASTSAHGHWAGRLSKYAPGLDNYPDSAYVTDVITDKAIHFIQKNKNRKFFLFVSHYAVHCPLQAKKEKIEKYSSLVGDDQNNAVYAAMIESVDESVGRILDELNRQGLRKNTLVIFTSDNGGLTPHSTSNYPLLGGKSFAYEAGTRVPFIMNWPGRIKGGIIDNQRIISVDILPTLLEVAGDNPNMYNLDGVSLGSIINGQQIKKRALFFHFPHYTSYTSPYTSVIKNNWKLIRFYNNPETPYQLFNLQQDPFEKKDLSGKNPPELTNLITVMDRFIDQTNAEIPLKNPTFDSHGKNISDKNFTYLKAIEIWNTMNKKHEAQK